MLLPSIAGFIKSVTLEPAMILYYTSLTLTILNGQNLILQKACHPGDSVPLPTTKCQNELESQKLATQIQTWKQLILLFGPVFFVLFAGSWSDNHGKRRKPLMYLPLCGQILSDLLCILNVYFWRWSPAIAALSESILPALTGWRSCFVIGVSSFIADITSEKSRTVRLGVCTALYFLGSPIGAFIFGLVFHKIGFYGVFLLCVVLNTGALTYLFFFISENEPSGCTSKLRAWEGLVDPKNVVQSVKTTFRPRNGFKRSILLLLILVAPINLASLQGEFAVLYFFLRYKFNWNEVDYGFYAAYKFIIICCGTVVTLGLLSRVLGIPDAVIGMMASVTLMIASVGYALSSTVWELFVYPIVDFMQGAGLAVVLSIASKNIENTELGQVNSMMGVADALFPLFNYPLYNQVYNHTFTKMPGAFFFLSVMYGAIAFFIFGVVFVLQRVQKIQDVQTEKSKL